MKKVADIREVISSNTIQNIHGPWYPETKIVTIKETIGDSIKIWNRVTSYGKTWDYLILVDKNEKFR